jgi:LytR cell envelope-related transcriptional attenuator
MTRRRMLAIAVLVVGVAVAAVLGVRSRIGHGAVVTLGDTTRAPVGVPVLVEVLNASGVSGLARRATFLIRDRGFDVVAWGNDPAGRRSQTQIIDYTDRPEAADRLARVLGGAEVTRGRDSLKRGLDLTVRLGSAFKPPLEAFHP